jgi:hypothetical protein
VLFEKAYAKCYAFLQSHDAVTIGLHEISHAWIHDFETAGGRPKGVRRFSKALEGVHPGGDSLGNSSFSVQISQQSVMAESRTKGSGGEERIRGTEDLADMQYTTNPMQQAATRWI